MREPTGSVFGVATEGNVVIVWGELSALPDSQPDPGSSSSLLRVSLDGGVTWDPALGWLAAVDGAAGSIAIHGGMAVLTWAGGPSALWAAELPSAKD
jgi:hypothetical protein